MKSLVPSERIERSILFIRGHKVILDAALAGLYGVSPKRLNERSAETSKDSLRISCFS
jgi:hypothetical protein